MLPTSWTIVLCILNKEFYIFTSFVPVSYILDVEEGTSVVSEGLGVISKL